MPGRMMGSVDGLARGQHALPPFDPETQALVLVDFTPQWLVPDRIFEEVWDRLWTLINEGGGIGLPVLPVNLSEIRRVSFTGIKTAFLAGCYGRLCVDDVALHLRRMGIAVFYVLDGIVWADHYLPDASEDEYLGHPCVADLCEWAGDQEQAADLRNRAAEWVACTSRRTRQLPWRRRFKPRPVYRQPRPVQRYLDLARRCTPARASTWPVTDTSLIDVSVSVL